MQKVHIFLQFLKKYVLISPFIFLLYINVLFDSFSVN